MTVLYICLVIVGLVLVFVSYRISEKFVQSNGDRNMDVYEQKFKKYMERDSLNEDEIQLVQKKVTEILNDKRESLVADTDDTLARISNEKIIALNDYSNEILAKIDKNHSEVVFLYDMLGNKERDLTSIAAHIKESVEEGTKLLEDIHRTKDELESVEKTSKESRAAFNERAAARRQRVSQSETLKKTIPLNNEADDDSKLAEEKAADTISEVQPENLSSGEAINHNDRILKLHREGKSVLDISKLLNLGQGEVKLVLDLFRGAKR